MPLNCEHDGFLKQRKRWVRAFEHIRSSITIWGCQWKIIFKGYRLRTGCSLRSHAGRDFGSKWWCEPDNCHWITVYVSFLGVCFCCQTDPLSVCPSAPLFPLSTASLLALPRPHDPETTALYKQVMRRTELLHSRWIQFSIAGNKITLMAKSNEYDPIISKRQSVKVVIKVFQ